jgi:hypothetical protein
VIEAALEAMVNLGASFGSIRVAIGPCIGQSSYEVGPEFIERFLGAAATNAGFFEPSIKAGHYMFDLAAYVESRLREAGIVKIYHTGYDTCRDEALFYSYRRSQLSGEKDYGREISAISLVS